VKKVEPHPPEDEQYKRACVLAVAHATRVRPDATEVPDEAGGLVAQRANPGTRSGRGVRARLVDEALDLVADKMQSLKRITAQSVLFHEGGELRADG